VGQDGDAIELEVLDRRSRARLKSPLMSRQHPRPADNLAWPDVLQLEHRSLQRGHFQRQMAPKEQMEVFGRLPLVKQHLARTHFTPVRVLGEKFDCVAVESREQSAVGNYLLDVCIRHDGFIRPEAVDTDKLSQAAELDCRL
jgi:hypothetical protein